MARFGIGLTGLLVASLVGCGGSSATSGSPAASVVAGSTTSPSLVASTVSPSPSPPVANESSRTTTAVIGHPTGSTDIVLRFDNLPDHGLGELDGESFRPGPEFTLYGDGIVVFRDELAAPLPADGAIVRAGPFRTGRLAESQVQSLLGYALGEGGLRAAPRLFESHVDTDDPGHSFFMIRADGIDKRVEVIGSTHPFQALADRLRNLDRAADLVTWVWEAERYRGALNEAAPWIDLGVLPRVSEAGVVPWPWTGIGPADFVGLSSLTEGRREMSVDEAAVLGFSDKGGAVQRIYLRGPDGTTIYSFSLWPVLPDEMG
jgi:hypothetical protein